MPSLIRLLTVRADDMESSPDRVVDRFTELLDEVDSEEIAADHRVGLHSDRHDFQEHAKIGTFLGIHDPKTLDDLDQQTDVRVGLLYCLMSRTTESMHENRDEDESDG